MDASKNTRFRSISSKTQTTKSRVRTVMNTMASTFDFILVAFYANYSVPLELTTQS